jgi:hypothetical protein
VHREVSVMQTPVLSLLVISILTCARGLAAPTVVAVSPSSQSLTAPRNAPVTVTFSTAVDPATVNGTTVRVFGRWTGVVGGTLQLENNNTRIRFTPTTLFSAGDMILVTISKGIRDQQGESLAKGYSWLFWIATATGSLNYTEIGRIPVRRSGEGHIQTYGAHGCDLNKDGFSDFFVPNEITNDSRVFLNNGLGTYSSFTVYPMPGASRPSTNDCADFNLDGNPDIAVGSSAGDSVTVFLGDGTGSFLSIRNYRAASGVRGLTVGDLDGDGDADIVTANRSGNNLAILLNNGDGTFAPRTLMEANGNAETGCALADANNDGILDLFVGAYTSSELILLLGDGNGGFVYAAKVSTGGSAPWMIAVGDMNGDGNVDVVSANSNSASCSVIFGNGQGGLSPAVTYATGSFPIAIDVGDIDGDGDLDLVTSNYSGRNWSVYENNGAGVLMNRRTLAASLAGSCATLHDRDNDGDLDMTGIDEESDLIFLFENRPPTFVGTPASSPALFSLHQNYPNPFNPETEIRFDMPRAGRVSLVLYDMRGREVMTLLNQDTHAGAYAIRWHGTDDGGMPVASGMYLCRMSVLNEHQNLFVAVRKLVLVR